MGEDREILESLKKDLFSRAKIICMNESFCPGPTRIRKWIDTCIVKFFSKYTKFKVDIIIEEMENDLTEEEGSNKELDLLDYYIDNADDYDYKLEKDIAERIMIEMGSGGINRDEDFEPIDFLRHC